MGESTTSAVVISLVSIFVCDFALSFLFFQVGLLCPFLPLSPIRFVVGLSGDLAGDRWGRPCGTSAWGRLPI